MIERPPCPSIEVGKTYIYQGNGDHKGKSVATVELHPVRDELVCVEVLKGKKQQRTGRTFYSDKRWLSRDGSPSVYTTWDRELRQENRKLKVQREDPRIATMLTDPDDYEQGDLLSYD